MRQIKCRAWDEVDKKMWFTGQEGETDEKGDAVFQTYFDEDGCLSAILITEMDVGCSQPMVTDRELKVMEYTGTNGKNDTKIYEGDVVKGPYWKGGKKNRFIGQVQFRGSAFKVVGVKQYFGMDQELHPLYEVIGNVWNHPHLVEVAE